MKNRFIKPLFFIVIIISLGITTIIYAPKEAISNTNLASPSDDLNGTIVSSLCCGNCPTSHCVSAVISILGHHAAAETIMLQHMFEEFAKHKNWMIDIFFKQHILPAMMMMSEQASAIAYQQMQIVGAFYDAKEQLEAQQLTQELEYQAHKDYQPSEDFCYFGTNVRSLHSTNAKARFTREAINERNMSRFLGAKSTSGAGSVQEELQSRWEKFQTIYCDPADNNMTTDGGKAESGLNLACQIPSYKQRINADVDFTRIIETPRTINANFTQSNPGKEGEDILALVNNLYGHKSITRQFSDLSNPRQREDYMELRSITAKRNVAQNTINAIISMKTSGSKKSSKTAAFMGELLSGLGVPPEEITPMLGTNPSYYAQIETLAKRIAQSPDFYVDLYDKPANVARKGAAIKALELMIERDMYESQLRREMLISVLLSSKLEREVEPVELQLRGRK